MKITESIKKYLGDLDMDSYHRYKSWDFCYEAFAVSQKNDRHALELGFYLASWGMYRGSCALLQKNYKVHEKAVDILFSQEAQAIKCKMGFKLSKENIHQILKIKEKLSNYYTNVNVSPTDTLISKIMLGTLGCMPAYDEYFIAGIKSVVWGRSSFNEHSLLYLFKFIEDNELDVLDAQTYISEKLNTHYPVMKVLDMYFWQKGYEIEQKNRQKQKSRY